MRWKVWYNSSESNCNSSKALSILFMNKMGLIRSAMACLSTVSVWTHTPTKHKLTFLGKKK